MMKGGETVGKAMNTEGTRAYVSKEDMMNKENRHGPRNEREKGESTTDQDTTVPENIDVNKYQL